MVISVKGAKYFSIHAGRNLCFDVFVTENAQWVLLLKVRYVEINRDGFMHLIRCKRKNSNMLSWMRFAKIYQMMSMQYSVWLSGGAMMSNYMDDNGC